MQVRVSLPHRRCRCRRNRHRRRQRRRRHRLCRLFRRRIRVAG